MTKRKADKRSKQRARKKPQLVDTVWENVKQVFIAIVLALIIKTSVVEAYKIPTSSMEDTLLVGDFLLANKFVYGARLPLVNWQLPAIDDPENGDVIIFIYPGDGVTKYIKRCVGLPGDTIEVKDKVLYVNGEIFPDPEFSKYTDVDANGNQHILPRRAGGAPSRDNFGPYIVPPDRFFMMGDNRDNSSDSRYWGPVPRQNVLGEAILVHWSWSEEEYPSPEVSVSDPLSVPRLFVYNTVHFFQKVRWPRLFGLIS
jgi:signal peptidase I